MTPFPKFNLGDVLPDALADLVPKLRVLLTRFTGIYSQHTHPDDPVAAANVQPGSLAAGDFTVTGALTVSSSVIAQGNIIVSGDISSDTGDVVVQDNVTINGTLAVSGKIASSGGSVASGYFDNGNSGASITINWSKGNYQTVVLTANCTLTYSNAPTGLPFFLVLVQDGTGSRTVTHDANVFWSGGTPPTLTTTASKADVVMHIKGSAGILAALDATWKNF